MTTPPENGPDRALLESHIRRRVAASALREIRQVAAKTDDEDRVAARAFRTIMLVLLVIAAVAVIAITAHYLFSNPPRDFGRTLVAADETSDPAVRDYVRRLQVNVARARHDSFAERVDLGGRFGTVVLDVYVKADGSIRTIKRVEGSDHKQLAELAEAIVRRASPFAAFSIELARRADTLVIRQTLVF